MRTNRTWKFITETATDAGQLASNKARVQFHMFNPNGMHARSQGLEVQVEEAVLQGKAKSGALIAYSFDHPERLARHYLSCERVSTVSYEVWTETYRRCIASTSEFLANL